MTSLQRGEVHFTSTISTFLQACASALIVDSQRRAYELNRWTIPHRDRKTIVFRQFNVLSNPNTAMHEAGQTPIFSGITVLCRVQVVEAMLLGK
jgi:hypothetical protein